MKRPENVETARILGYLGADSVLYCSPACAAQVDQVEARPVDEDDLPALVDRGAVVPAVCPVCGSEFPLGLGAEDGR